MKITACLMIALTFGFAGFVSGVGITENFYGKVVVYYTLMNESAIRITLPSDTKLSVFPDIVSSINLNVNGRTEITLKSTGRKHVSSY